MFKIIDGQNEFKGLISLDYLKYFIKLYKGSFTISALYTFWLFLGRPFLFHTFLNLLMPLDDQKLDLASLG